jgi:hypothetical protein
MVVLVSLSQNRSDNARNADRRHDSNKSPSGNRGPGHRAQQTIAFVTKILYDLFPLQRPKIHELIELTAYKIVKISLLNITGKIFERILTNKLNLLLESHNLLPPEQFDFRAQRSTQNPIVERQTDITKTRQPWLVHRRCLSGHFRELLKYRISAVDKKLEEHLQSAHSNATYKLGKNE